jgi:molybdopterin synthase catalytic subunit
MNTAALLQLHWCEGAISSTVLADWAVEAGKHHDLGAYSIFCGQVRADVSGESMVKGIEYSAYQSMVERTLHDFINSADEKSNIKAIKIAQSIGFVPSGGLSLVLFIASAHRKELLEAQKKFVEFLKFKVPVWKKEIFEDGSYRWISS